MSNGQDSWSTVEWLRSAMRRAPSLTICITVYYAALIFLGVLLDITDPLNGILNILFFTHLFVLVAPFVHGPAAILLIVGVPVAIALCAVSLKGWWRLISIMAMVIGTHLFGIVSAALVGP